LEDKELELLVKKVPKTYWFDKKAESIFYNNAIFLKEKGLENEEIKKVISELYKASSYNNGFYDKRMA